MADIPTLLHELLERTACRVPGKSAVEYRGGSVSYAELDELSNRIANGLIDLGCRKQDRVVLYSRDDLATVGGIFAVCKAGGVFSIVDSQVKIRKLAHILRDCRARMLITDSPQVVELLETCPKLEQVIVTGSTADDTSGSDSSTCNFWELAAKSRADRPSARVIGVDLCSLIYTSGSTGAPRGVMLTHLNMISALRSIASYLELTSNDRILNLSSLSFDYGLYNVLLACQVGASVLLKQPFQSVQQIIRPVKQEGVTGLPLVPAMIAMLLCVKDLDHYDFSGVRYVTSTGQALPQRHIERLVQWLPSVRIYSMYGLTECKRVSYLPPDELLSRPMSVGKAIPDTEAFIVDDDEQRVDEPGQIGELVVRGPHVMEGYWNQPEETARIIRGSSSGRRLLFTGDLFRQDADGYLYFVGRRDDLIKTGAERVSPKEIESVVYELDEVIEAVVIGIEDEILGQALKLAVALKQDSSVTADGIRRHCTERLERSRVPRIIEIRDTLPKTNSGKIDRRTLRQGDRPVTNAGSDLAQVAAT